jgi:hypothetical protein
MCGKLSKHSVRSHVLPLLERGKSVRVMYGVPGVRSKFGVAGVTCCSVFYLKIAIMDVFSPCIIFLSNFLNGCVYLLENPS